MEIVFLEENYSTTPNQEIADELERSLSSIKNKAFAMNLRKDPTYTNPAHYPKDNRPWNKGKKGEATSGAFVRGHTPANTCADGEIRTDKRGYIRQKALGKWVYRPKTKPND